MTFSDPVENQDDETAGRPEASVEARIGKYRRRRRRFRRGLLVLFALIALGIGMAWWNTIRMPGKSHQAELPAAEDELSRLADELRRDVEHLAVKIGERNVGNRPRELGLAADWLEGQFKEAGYEPSRQAYEVSGVTCFNIDVEIRGNTRADEIVIVGAHYDTVIGTAGANDNTSGVAATLALARRFADKTPDRTLRFVALVNEEPPYFQTDAMGSRVYARRCAERQEKVVAMLSLETIGYYSDEEGSQSYPPLVGSLYPSRGNFIAVIGNAASADLVSRVVGTFREHEPFPCEGAGLPEAVVPAVGFSDQWSFWQEGYPAAMVTDTAMLRYPHYHTSEDTIDKLGFDRMSRVVRGLEQVVRTLVSTGEPGKESKKTPPGKRS